MAWLPPQEALLRCEPPPGIAVLLRMGNQGGKTWAGIADMIFCCLGAHPFRKVRPGPITAWVACSSWSQSIEIQAKVWELLPKDEIAESTAFDEVRGFRGKHPTVRFRNGSIIRFKTINQDTKDLASATIDYVLCDEPPTERVFTELLKRVEHRGGRMVLTLTPVNAELRWLRELCEAGLVRDLHYRFRPENFIPVGRTRPITLDDAANTPKDAEWVARIRRQTSATQAAQVLDAEWDVSETERTLSAWHPGLIFDDLPPLKPGGWTAGIGIDHGENAGKEVAYLVAWDGSTLWVLAEYVGSGRSTLEQDADGIVGMIIDCGLRVSDIGRARGDVNSAGRYAAGETINAQLGGAIARAGGVAAFAINVPNKARWSVALRIRTINRAMAEGRFRVHRSCDALLRTCSAWVGARNNAHKDPFDAVAYIGEDWLSSVMETSTPAPRRISLRRAG